MVTDESNFDSLIDQLRLILKSSNDEVSGIEIIQKLFEKSNFNNASESSLLEHALRSHNHVGAFRQLPEERITERGLGFEASPWRKLLDDKSNNSQSPIAFTNFALNLLDIKYKVAVRLRKEIAYLPQTADQVAKGTKLREDYHVLDKEVVFIDEQGVAHGPHSLGSGVGVIVPLIVALATSLIDIISIEEPESHVHPRLQAALGDLLIIRSKMVFVEKEDPTMSWEEEFDYLHHEADASERYGYMIDWEFLKKVKSNIILETHSEHLILRILRRIRESTEKDFGDWSEELKKACPEGVRPEDVAVLYVKPGKDGAQVETLRINELGEFVDEWPGGFFDERIQEIL